MSRHVMKRSRKTGFTLIELLVVITILGMLMALIFPAFSGVMEAARQVQCQNNLKGLATATTTFLSARQRYPGLVEARGFGRGNEAGNRCTWATLLLEQLGETATAKTWEISAVDTGRSSSQTTVSRPMEVKNIKVLTCPDDTQDGLTNQPLSYVANAGSSFDAVASPVVISRQSQTTGGRSGANNGGINFANGIFFNRYTGSQFAAPAMTTSRIVDGMNQTALFTENIQAWQWGDKRQGLNNPVAYDTGTITAIETVQYTGFIWDSIAFNQGEKEEDVVSETAIAPNIRWARPSSNHGGIVMMVFCSNNVKPVSDTIEPWIYRRLVVSDRNKSGLALDDPARINPLKPEDY